MLQLNLAVAFTIDSVLEEFIFELGKFAFATGDKSMSVEDAGRQMGQLSIEHFANPNDDRAQKAIEKILAETPPEEMYKLVKQARQYEGKTSISPVYEKCGQISAVDFTFHPLWSLKPLGKDISINVLQVPECKAKESPQKKR